MRRVSVIGVSGSGKTTLARRLAAAMGVPHVELDSIFHQPNWTPLPDDEFRARVAARIADHGWVVDGNYATVRPLVWAAADTVVWLDPPRARVMRRLLVRSVRRGVRQEELWNGNRERLGDMFRPADNLLLLSWRKHPEYRVRYGAGRRDPVLAHLTFVRVASDADADALVAAAIG